MQMVIHAPFFFVAPPNVTPVRETWFFEFFAIHCVFNEYTYICGKYALHAESVSLQLAEDHGPNLLNLLSLTVWQHINLLLAKL